MQVLEALASEGKKVLWMIQDPLIDAEFFHRHNVSNGNEHVRKYNAAARQVCLVLRHSCIRIFSLVFQKHLKKDSFSLQGIDGMQACINLGEWPNDCRRADEVKQTLSRWRSSETLCYRF